jgi:branched-subunit amino acid transport protein
MRTWLIIVAIGLVTYVLRFSMIALAGRVELPPLVQRGLSYVPPAVLSAIILPELLYPDGAFTLTFANTRLIAGVLATLVAWRTRNVLLTIAAGMAVFWLLGAVL